MIADLCIFFLITLTTRTPQITHTKATAVELGQLSKNEESALLAWPASHSGMAIQEFQWSQGTLRSPTPSLHKSPIRQCCVSIINAWFLVSNLSTAEWHFNLYKTSGNGNSIQILKGQILALNHVCIRLITFVFSPSATFPPLTPTILHGSF